MLRIVLMAGILIASSTSYATKKLDACLDGKYPSDDSQVLMHGCDLTAEDMPDLVTILNQYPDRKLYLDFGNNDIGSGGIGDKGLQILMKAKNIETLYLDHNHITDEGVKYLIGSQIKDLSLSHNEITAKSVEMITHIDTLITVGLNANALDDSAAKFLAKSKIKTLSVINNRIGPEGAIELAKSPYLKWLEIDENHIFDKGFSTLITNSGLMMISASRNNITDKSMHALAANHTLEIIVLSNNLISDDGVAVFAQTTSNNYKDIDFSCNYNFTYMGQKVLEDRFGSAVYPDRCALGKAANNNLIKE